MDMDYIEVTEKTVEDCITTACQKLSVVSDRLDYVVISEGSRGFLGMGAKPATIKARIKAASERTDAVLNEILNNVGKREEEAAKKAQEAIEAEKKRKIAAAAKAEEDKKAAAAAKKAAEEMKAAEAAKKAEKLAAMPEVTKEEEAAAEEERPYGRRDRKNRDGRRDRRDRYGRGRGDRDNRYREEEFTETEEEVDEAPVKHEDSRKEIPADKQFSDEKVAEIEKKAEDFLLDVFDKMKMEVKISMTFDKQWNTLNIDLEGDDMGVLIGKRGQTLDSLQYLVSLVINRGSDLYIHVKADTENYRERRKETLESLAKNIAYKVKRTRRPVELEPMNPYERRIIHSALQNDRYVTTHSEGEEPFRKVVVTLKSRNR